MNNNNSLYNPSLSTANGHAPALHLWAAFIAAALFAASPGHAADRHWTGALDGSWSQAGNWDPAGLPQDGDNLIFDHDSNNYMTNDLAASPIIHSLVFGSPDSLIAPDFFLSGQPVYVSSAITLQLVSYSSYKVWLSCAINLAGDVDVRVSPGENVLTDPNELYFYYDAIFLGPNSMSMEAISGSGGTGSAIYAYGLILGTGDITAYSGPNSSISIGGPDSIYDNIFTGKIFLFDGFFNFNKASAAVVTNAVVVFAGQVAHLNLAAPNEIGNHATLEVDDGSQLLLTGNNVTVGRLVLNNVHADASPSTLDSGTSLVGLNDGITASVDNDHVHPTVKGRLNLVGYTQFNITGGPEPGLEIQAPISGNGFQKYGAGTLRLSGNNTYFGDVEAIEGNIEADTPTAFGQAGPTYGVHLEGGNITLQNVAIGNEPLFVNSSNSLLTAINQCSWSGPVTLNTSLNVVPLDPTFTTKTMDFYGAINGSGGLNLLSAIFGVGSVRLLGSSGNLFTGPTVVQCSLLQLGKPSGVNAYAGPLIVGNSGGTASCEVRWLQPYQNVGATATLYANGIININNYIEDFGPITFNGGEVDTGTGSFNIYAPVTVNPAPTSAVINGYLGLPPGDNRVFIVGDGPPDCDLVINAVIFGSPGTYFVKHGPGTICLTAANTFNAPTLLEEGIVDINNGSGLGTWPGLVIFDGATLRLNGSGTGNGCEVIGAGVGGTHGAVEVVANASWNIATGILLDGPTTFNVGTGAGLGLIAPISSSGPGCSVIKTGSGVLSFGGTTANTYSGDTIISAGQCYLSKSANVISVPGNLIIGPGPAGPVTFARLAQTGGIGGSSVTVNGNSLFDLFGNNLTMSQIILNDGGNLQTSGGVLTLPNGSLVRVGSLDPVLGSRATSTIGGSINLPFSGNITVSVNPFFLAFIGGPELDVPAVISGGVNHGNTATLIKEGLGRMRLSGNNTFPGNLNINAGAVIAANANALGTTFRGTLVSNGAQLVLDGGVNIAGEYITLDSTNVPALESSTGPNSIGGVLYLNRNSAVGPMSPTETLFANGQIDGPGSLTKVGLGTLSLGGPTGNTFAGETFVNQGTLLMNKPIALTAIPTALEIGALDDSTAGTARNLNSYQVVGNIYVHSRGLYDVNGQQENTDALVMYGNATVQTGAGYVSLKTGAPIYVYPGTNTTSTINGTVMLDPGGHILNVGSGATTSGVQDLVINAVIGETSSGGALQKEGAGRMRLAANNSYTGTTTVNAGTLQVDGSQGQSAVTVNSGTLQGSGTVGAVSLTSASATVSPGASPGILNSGSFGGGSGTVRIELNGTTPGTGYDQLNVSGSVNLSGMSLNASLGYASSTNDQFTIINNDGTDPVIGTFSGLPQGKKLYIGQELFQISYAGGSGNDVVLSRLITPPPPALAIQSVSASSVRLVWPTNDPPFSLQTASSLPATNWSAALPLPVVIGSNNVVTNSLSGTEGFYRLSGP